MFRQALEAQLGFRLSDDLFASALKDATDDIKFNRIGFNKKTNYVQAMDIITICAKVIINRL